MPGRINDGIVKRCRHSRKYWAECRCPWWFSFFHAGRAYRYSLRKLAEARHEPPPRTRDEAIAWRDRLRGEIRAGTFRDPDETAASTPAAASTPWTFGDICEQYLARHVRIPSRRPRARREMEILVALARRALIPGPRDTLVRLEDKPIDAITKPDIEAVRTWRRHEQARKAHVGAKGGEVAINRLLSRLRHIFTWAIGEGYLTDTPFRRGHVTVVKLERRAESARTRRLHAGEERALLDHADPHLRALLVAALTTGCRLGELLSLQWRQIRVDERGEARWIELPAAKTKTAEPRIIPIGPRLRAELSLRRHAPDGREHPPDAYVFGTETGEPVQSVRRSWEDTVLRAHGHEPVRTRGKLSRESRAALRAIDLHFHDLRREFASRLLESSADLHDVRDFLGHAAITTTSRYLQSTPTRLERALERLEAQSASFAHHLHKRARGRRAAESTTTPEDARNSLH
jgi:integrase